MARILAIDYGLKRTGIAVTDELQLIASGLTTVASKDLIVFLKDYIKNEKVELFLVGEPKQMDNSPSESELIILPFLSLFFISSSYFNNSGFSCMLPKTSISSVNSNDSLHFSK